MALSDFFGHLQHLGPIHRVNAHVRRLFGQGDSPNSGACADVQDGDRSFGSPDAQMFSQFACRWETQWKERLNKLCKELLTFPLGIDLSGRPAKPHDFSEIQPSGQKLVTDMLKKRAMI